ncbi:serine/threonine kinase like domain containing 1 [Turdus rufiventris]|nr:serine/threonine kinase like domain containing 1 [Turdus rufiventris]
MDLLKLHHSNICTYKELFVTWNNEVVQRFLGQMVDALFYIHKQNIWHRNLKPSNILVTGEASFMLSDFSTETLMKDELKWKIRVEEEEINSLLQDIRGDSSCLVGVLTLMQDGERSYFPFFPILLMMLQIEPSMRPTARDLVTLPFIGKCLTVAGDTSIKLKMSLSPTIRDLLFQGGVESVLEFMQAFWDIEEIQAEGIQHLASFVKDRSAFPYLLTCTEVITLAMKTHTDSLDLQVEGCTLLLEILSQEVAAENLRKVGIIPDFLSILRRFLHNDKICLSGCAILWSLAVSGNSEDNADQAVLDSAVPVTCAVLQNHLQNGVVAESACSALWALALQGCLTDSDYEPTAALLLDALRMNPERAVLVKNGCLALASLVRLSETAALAILLDSKGSGVELMKHEYHLHCEEPGVAEALCLLMNEMVQYGEIAAAGT